MAMTLSDLEDLKVAKNLLGKPGLASKISKFLETPIEKGFELLPPAWAQVVQETAQSSLMRALRFAVKTLNGSAPSPPANLLHRLLVAATGAVGGAGGLPALTIELPISTTLMLRSIADIARSQGERIELIEPRLACLEVFALGSRLREDDPNQMGYFAVRLALARAVSEAATYILERGLAEEGAPALIRLISRIAARFSVVVSEKVAAQAIPLIGAAGGAWMNTIFITHYQEIARGHFTVRRLERSYGREEVRASFERI